MLVVRLVGHTDSSPSLAVQRLVEGLCCEREGEVESGQDRDPGCGGNQDEGAAKQRQLPAAAAVAAAAAAAAEPMVLALLRGGRNGVFDAGVGEVTLVARAVGEVVAS